MNAETFSAQLRRLREERGLSLAQIAGPLGVSKPTVWAWENGKANPLASRIGALAAILGVPASDLAGPTATSFGDRIADLESQIENLRQDVSALCRVVRNGTRDDALRPGV